MRNKFDFWHMEDNEFAETWKTYKDATEELMEETSVARLGFKNVEIYIALEKEHANEYITIFTTVCEDGEWRTADFFNDETERNDKIKSALCEKNWNSLQQTLFSLINKYCKEKNIIIEEFNNCITDNEKVFVMKSIDFPANNITELEKEAKRGYIDIPCRIYLENPPCKEYELMAKNEDKENYNPSCFFIEALAGRNGLEEPWQTSNWFVFYVNNDGVPVLLDDTIELSEAWNYMKKEYESIMNTSSLDTKIRVASNRAANMQNNIIPKKKTIEPEHI